MDWWQAVLTVGGGVLLLWALLILLLWRARPEDLTVREALRLLPDLVRLVRRVAVDRSLPRGVRVRLWLLLGYLLSPVDLVPDIVPVLGYADDVVVVAVALRWVVRTAGSEALLRAWPGGPAGLAVVLRLAGRGRSRPDVDPDRR
ncbi:uncharacterized protein DUF1232 [Blastococcus colisei]|uniref:Uncharacterized protein DUF1232 n=1 Tax=Blastococcus colisei TaxID=1564162 RepID=A0A543PCV4_9ACTN|nr:DUF1232 domain-containing protein [Blastococcus colisei]TQN41913.1 uncharacterized protein DUF1232 [Blastococcus colisei]